MNRPGRRQPSIKTGPGVIVLSQVAARLPAIDVACNRCDWRGRVHTARPVVEYGADIPAPLRLRTIVADCPRMQSAAFHDVCGVHMPQLARGR